MKTTDQMSAVRGRPRTKATLLLTVILSVVLSGCGLMSRGVYDTALPGGADLGNSPYELSADFADVLDLVPQSAVKVDNVAVGRVSAIILNEDGRSARVSMDLNGKVSLPAGTTARVQQTSLLGEKYVALVRPESTTAAAPLVDGDVVTLAATSQAVGVEEVLGALSMLLNGGGVGQFQDISRELQAVSTGRPEEIKAFLDEMESFVTTLDDRSDSITDALDGLAALSKTLDGEKGKIENALDNLSPGMKVLVDQREDLVKMLTALDRLSVVSVRTLDAAQDDMVADLKLLDPILKQLAQSGSDLPYALQILLTYPFPDSVLGAISGDYLNVFITTNFNTPGTYTPQESLWPASASRSPAKSSETPGTISPPPMILPTTSSATPGLESPTVTIPTPTTDPTPSDPTPTATDPTATDPTPTATDPTPTATQSKGEQ